MSGDLELPRRRARAGDGPVVESSAGTVGLQSAETFKTDMDLKRRRDADAFKSADPTLAGQGAATVFRDKQGRKIDVVAEARRKAEEKEARDVAEAEAKYDWGTGRVQKDLAAEREEEERKLAAAPFARWVDGATWSLEPLPST